MADTMMKKLVQVLEPGFDDVEAFRQNRAMREVKNILKVLRTPTEAMHEAGIKEFDKMSDETAEPLTDSWQAMIDAVLSEGSET